MSSVLLRLWKTNRKVRQCLHIFQHCPSDEIWDEISRWENLRSQWQEIKGEGLCSVPDSYLRKAVIEELRVDQHRQWENLSLGDVHISAADTHEFHSESGLLLIFRKDGLTSMIWTACLAATGGGWHLLESWPRPWQHTQNRTKVQTHLLPRIMTLQSLIRSFVWAEERGVTTFIKPTGPLHAGHGENW